MPRDTLPPSLNLRKLRLAGLLAAAVAVVLVAAGAATGRTPLAIVVPCHRIIGSDGSLTGYAGGLDRKRALLALEADGAILRSAA